MINKYLYTLLRSEYVSNGCQNYKVIQETSLRFLVTNSVMPQVRPAMPAQFIEQLYKCKPVMTEPLFKMWKETDLETTRSRMAAMVKMWAKRNQMV